MNETITERQDLAQSEEVGMLLDDVCLPISEEVKGASEIVGTDPLYVANEWKPLAIVAAQDVDLVLSAMKSQ